VKGTSTLLKAHAGAVRSVNFGKDGKSLLTAGDDKTVKIWALPSKRFMATLSGHSNWVRTAVFSPDQQLVASGGDDKTVRVWDATKGQLIQTYYDPTDIVTSVQFHPEGTSIACGSNDKTLKLWDIRSEKLVQYYQAHDGPVTSVRFHPSGNYVLTSSADSTLKIWDIREGTLLYTLRGHGGATTGVAFSPKGDFFASSSDDESVMVWKTNFDTPIDSAALHFDGHGRAQENDRGSNAIHVHSSPSRNSIPSNIKSKVATISVPSVPKIDTPLAETTNILPKENVSAIASAAPSLPPAKVDHASQLPEVLSKTLDYIVGQLDLITENFNILEQRIADVERVANRLDRELLDKNRS
jgi:centriolar protein POC1